MPTDELKTGSAEFIVLSLLEALVNSNRITAATAQTNTTGTGYVASSYQ
jgi:hypothetical protein